MRPRVVCLDVDGTLTDGVLGPPLPGAIEALRLIRAQLPVRLVSNTTSITHRTFAARLMAQDLLDASGALLTPAATARRVLPARGHASGLLLVEPEARADYAWFREDPDGRAVVLATEAHDLTIRELQPAFRRLLDGAAFYALQRNRYFLRRGKLVTDLGPVAAFLSCAAGCEPETLGKPSPLLYDSIAAETGVRREEIVMVGDDAEVDVSASVAIGMAGVLVRTGKYRAGDESRLVPLPTATLASVADLPGWLGI
ncbi:MAG TPA: HAD hydrolase-like protein [Candidatus Eisenbacteria bacterium]|jgi:HAD superfamily hydrolase (TIGR01458 family)